MGEQSLEEMHPSQDEILKSGKWSIGNRTKYFGIKPKTSNADIGIRPYVEQKIRPNSKVF